MRRGGGGERERERERWREGEREFEGARGGGGEDGEEAAVSADAEAHGLAHTFFARRGPFLSALLGSELCGVPLDLAAVEGGRPF